MGISTRIKRKKLKRLLFLRIKLKWMEPKWTQCGSLSTASHSNIGFGGQLTITQVRLWPIALVPVDITIWISCVVCWLRLRLIPFMLTRIIRIEAALPGVMLLQERKILKKLSGNTFLSALGVAGLRARVSVFLNHIYFTSLLSAW